MGCFTSAAEPLKERTIRPGGKDDRCRKNPVMKRLRTVNPGTDGRWDDFVSRHPSGLIYHRSAWARVIEDTFGHTPLYIALEDSWTGELNAAAPFFTVKSLLTGRRVVSLPFTTFCDPLMSPAKMTEILAFISERVPKARFIKMKLLDFKVEPGPAVQTSASYVTHFIDLRRSLDELFKSFHGSSVRQRIRRAERSGVTFRLGETEKDLQSFYRLLVDVRRRHGLPPHPYAFFKNMWKVLRPAGLLNLPLVQHEGRIVAGSIVLKSGTIHHYEYSASDEKTWKVCSNQKLLWEIIRMAHAEGARYLDLGRSAINNLSLIDYKERWSGKRIPLSYNTWPVGRRSSIPAQEGSGSNYLKQGLEFLNRYLPGIMLKWQGRLIYPHID
jgi:CelD/BcsL family acetyltransferase involved in cellulose biosynthesis